MDTKTLLYVGKDGSFRRPAVLLQAHSVCLDGGWLGKITLLRKLLALVGVFMLVSCRSQENGPNSGPQSAFRVRSSFDSGLNEDRGWAGRLNERVAITADRPFRIRFEVEPLATYEGLPFILQYRRNEGVWERVEAHDFPHPMRELDIEFGETYDGGLPPNWSVEPDNSSGVAVAQVGEQEQLRVRAQRGPQIVVYSPPWEVNELAAEIRLSVDNKSGAGFVFAFADGQNFCRVFLDATASEIRVSRVTNGVETTVAEVPAEIVTDQWLSLEIDLEGELAEINFQNDTLEFEAAMGTRTPSTQLGIYMPADCEADVREMARAGGARTPRVSIVSCTAFKNEKVTKNLLLSSEALFHPGSGVELSEETAA